MTDLLDRRLLFVTGKGGVGKTTVAAALALLAAGRGKRTLVGEVDAKGNLADFFSVEPTGWRPRLVQPNLYAMSMDTEESLKEYLALQLKLPLMAKMGPLARVFDFVATAAPGVREVLTVGKFLWEEDQRNYDFIVVDAAASGHVIGQLAAPEAINELVSVGLIRQQTGWMVDILGDPGRTGVCIVATPEEMPVNETIELAARLEHETNVSLAAVIVNRVLPELFGRGEEAVFERLETDEGRSALVDAVGPGAGPILDAARLAVTLRRTRAGHLDHLRSSLSPTLPLLFVPELFTKAHGLRSTRLVADALSAELGY
ncbi:MAG TPA: ArsA family ATPase [Acidimicrobiales bacterium]|nr:ArsA family ATPase [Acidimicrobiales bacterium]